MGHMVSSGILYKDWVDGAKEDEGGLLFVTVAVTTSWRCKPFAQVKLCFKIAYVLPQVPENWLTLNRVNTFSGHSRDDDPGGGTARVQDLREGGVPSFHAAVPPDDMSVVSVAQCRPEDGVKRHEDLVCLNAAPVKHPSPGARAKCDMCSMGVPVNMLKNFSYVMWSGQRPAQVSKTLVVTFIFILILVSEAYTHCLIYDYLSTVKYSTK